jgi:hypothetical protein
VDGKVVEKFPEDFSSPVDVVIQHNDERPDGGSNRCETEWDVGIVSIGLE